MKVSLIQMESNGTRAENEEKAINLINEAISDKTDIICLSELFFYWGEDYTKGYCNVEAIEKYQKIAMENNVNIILGSVALKDTKTNKTTNTCFVLNRKGEIVCRYDKKYMYKVNKENLKVDETEDTIPGSSDGIFEIDGVKMGVGICFDLRYPEYFRNLIKQGAEIIFLPAHFREATGKVAWDILTKARAIENQVYFCAINQTGEGNCANTRVISYDGKILKELGKEEGIITYDLNLEAERKFRRELPVLEQMK